MRCSLRELPVGGHEHGIEPVGRDEVARVIDADSTGQGLSKGLADEYVESNHVERQPQDAVERPLGLVSGDDLPANRNRERVGDLREGELRNEPADAPGHNLFNPCSSGRVVLAEDASDEGARVKNRAGGRSHGPVG